MSSHCDDDTLNILLEDLRRGNSDLGRINTALSAFPNDHRLHFLHGSILVEEGKLVEAHQALSRAIELEPDYAIARFQLGLFELTSGEAGRALETWGRLDALPDGHYLRAFLDGLRRLIRDDFAGAAQALQIGIDNNRENPALNHDMQLVIAECFKRIVASSPAEEEESETSFMLRKFNRPH